MKHNCGNKDIALRLSCSTQDMLVAMKCGKLYNACTLKVHLMYITCTLHVPLMYKLNGARMGPSVTNDTRMSDTLRFVAAAEKLSVDDILVPFVLDGPWRSLR